MTNDPIDLKKAPGLHHDHMCACGREYIAGTSRCPICEPPDIVEIQDCHNAGIGGYCGPDCDAYRSQLECDQSD